MCDISSKHYARMLAVHLPARALHRWQRIAADLGPACQSRDHRGANRSDVIRRFASPGCTATTGLATTQAFALCTSLHIYIYIYIFVHICSANVVCTCVCVCARLFLSNFMCEYTYVRTCIYLYMYMCVSIHIATRVCVCVFAHIL